MRKFNIDIKDIKCYGDISGVVRVEHWEHAGNAHEEKLGKHKVMKNYQNWL